MNLGPVLVGRHHWPHLFSHLFLSPAQVAQAQASPWLSIDTKQQYAKCQSFMEVSIILSYYPGVTSLQSHPIAMFRIS